MISNLLLAYYKTSFTSFYLVKIVLRIKSNALQASGV